MTTLRFPTIWDLPLPSRRGLSVDETVKAPVTERFLTIWDVPLRAKKPKSKRAPRKLSKFYI
ncbi:MAG: hypothetical protein JJU25_19420 [Halomonas sp.]|nr:hypothetical protein [Halomonas sp.]MCC5884795.1 hypothetical protein [Halomonas sp.]